MGESACLMNSFSYASGISNEAKQGNPMHALGESISFGRFMTESLSWEKWSSFSHNRYVEEASRYAQPGSVAQKKAFFEAHYKRIAAAKKAAALLEQANAANNADSEPEFQDQACNSTTHDSQCTMTNSLFDEQLEVKNTGAEVDSIVDVNGCNSWVEMEIGMVEAADSVAENEALVENSTKNRSLNHIENVVNQTTMVSEVGFGESPLMEKKPLLEGFKSGQVAPSPVSKKKPPFSSSKSSVHRRAPKLSATPAKPTAYIHPIKENDVTPITRKSPIDSVNKKRPTSKCPHTLIYSTPAKEPDKLTILAPRKTESSRVAHSSYKPSKDFKTPLRTPTMAYLNGVLKNPSATPCSENIRPRTPQGPSASGSKTTGPKWQILSTVCTRSLSACRNKLQSPTTSAPFSLRTEERAARRTQKLEEKFNAKEAEKVQLQTRLKDKAETETRKLRQNLCFKARPLPEFYKERETPKNRIKKRTPLTRPQSPKLGRKCTSSTLQGLTSQPPVTHSTKNSGPKNVLKQRSHIPNCLTSLPEMMITHENASPNIQH
ncbi:protein WVD2-like 7 isoform X2 [Camellia sinensis]|uniref:protein WVD2-like 7 isoform X2 n=1 Tax=Camellia sinensis TaxID=4442 RepID=UPI0010366D7E|nr:protein WVD2-like 7 isoform X2 [Camellia sinensis]